MKRNLTVGEILIVTSMLFGLFFGAGNLIFPIYMGELAGQNFLRAAGGFLITGVGLPVLGVAALGISRTDGVLELSSKVGKGYGKFFTCLLYLAIGPFFAIPRCATVPYEVGAVPILNGGASNVSLFIFSVVFFAAVLWFSLKPGEILMWVGKVLNPIFLVVLVVLVITALVFPMGEAGLSQPIGDYGDNAFFKGFLEGYNTMDALAGMAFGIVVVNVIRSLGINKPGDIARNTIYAGISSGILMGVIYIAVTAVGMKSRGLYNLTGNIPKNGGEIFAAVANHFFGKAGALILAILVTMACLKTAVGLITSCAETFERIFKKGPEYNVWAIIFTLLSLAIANTGLNTIIEYSLPMLMFLYPLAITLILMALFGHLFDNSHMVYRCVTFFTLIAALFDFAAALPDDVISILNIGRIVTFGQKFIPLYSFGLGWICPATIGFVIGYAIFLIKKIKEKLKRIY